MGDEAPLGFLGAGQDAVAALQGRGPLGPAHLGFTDNQAGRLAGGFGISVVRLGNQFALVDIDDLQGRDLRHPAHPVEG